MNTSVIDEAGRTMNRADLRQRIQLLIRYERDGIVLQRAQASRPGATWETNADDPPDILDRRFVWREAPPQVTAHVWIPDDPAEPRRYEDAGPVDFPGSDLGRWVALRGEG